MKTAGKSRNLLVLIPLVGALIFASLYFIATLFYPGGSQIDKNSKGFSWTQNYWCNLLNENALNGQHNASRPVALIAMFVLCVTLIDFWYIFPSHAGLEKLSRHVIQISGALSMIIGMFLFTAFHDIIVIAASICGIAAITGTFAGLRKLRWKKLFWLGIFNLALVVLNNILYYNKGLIIYLPIVQKISFLFFLLWICLMAVNLFYKTNLKP